MNEDPSGARVASVLGKEDIGDVGVGGGKSAGRFGLEAMIFDAPAAAGAFMLTGAITAPRFDAADPDAIGWAERADQGVPRRGRSLAIASSCRNAF